MARTTKPVPDASCPCGSGRPEVACCGALRSTRLGGDPGATTPEALMRSRYTAYVRGDTDYLRATWHPSTCPADLEHDPALRWLGLEIRHAEINADHGTVEFIARYKVGGRAQRLHEISRFVRENGRWYYVDGDFPEAARG